MSEDTQCRFFDQQLGRCNRNAGIVDSPGFQAINDAYKDPRNLNWEKDRRLVMMLLVEAQRKPSQASHWNKSTNHCNASREGSGIDSWGGDAPKHLPILERQVHCDGYVPRQPRSGYRASADWAAAIIINEERQPPSASDIQSIQSPPNVIYLPPPKNHHEE